MAIALAAGPAYGQSNAAPMPAAGEGQAAETSTSTAGQAPAQAGTAQPPAAAPTGQATTSVQDRTGGLQEIVVTAERRATNLQSTPIAVSAVDRSLIEQSSPRNIGDLAAFVPNFSAAKIAGF
ncbi:MAG TPA: hypothetical protein VFL92_05485, partial [Sphingomonas sp.]|nr:hypothetical protein [Sphingomonas sp.]